MNEYRSSEETMWGEVWEGTKHRTSVVFPRGVEYVTLPAHQCNLKP